MKPIFKSKSLPGLSKEDLNKLTTKSLAQSEAMSGVNARRTKEDYAKIQRKSMDNRNQSNALHTRWENADEETRKTNMDVARNKAYVNFAKLKDERHAIILAWLPNDCWISRKEWAMKWKSEGLEEKHNTPYSVVQQVISDTKYFKVQGTNARWMKYKKI
tara:strand:- start:186 stop:665 length:480 start_codon:yes stop_codon:yes gene_type:complete